MVPGEDVMVLRDVLIPGGRIADITLTSGKVTHVGSSGRSEIVLNCRDLFVIPAGIDMHVHMRDGPQAYKEDWQSGSQSALAGGVTVVIDQPNTLPPVTTPEILRERVDLAASQSYCQFGINAGVTPEADIEGMAVAGAMAFGETFAGPSSYGEALSKEELQTLMARIARFQGLMTMHAEVVMEGDDSTLSAHNILRPIDGEREAVRMISGIAPPDANIHFCHISSAETITEIVSQQSGSIEVTPHHLFLSTELFESEDPKGKVNPPLRTEKDRRHLWTCWDEIDVIGSDHAPHTVAEKSQSFDVAPSGIPGVETMIPLLMAEVLKGRISLISVIEKTSTNPAAILGISPAGYTVGMRADFALYQKFPEKIQTDHLLSKAGWTPYEGYEAVFPETVVMAGSLSYHEGECIKTEPAWFQGRGYNQGA